jgi:hypothetical protein
MALRPPVLGVDRVVAAPPEAVWQVLVDVGRWPQWGPSVRSAELHDATELAAGVRGTVETAVGVRLPFTITGFEAGRRWGWTVAGVPATGHEVTPVAGGSRVRFEVPWWAAGYLAVCAVALRRIESLAVSGGL